MNKVFWVMLIVLGLAAPWLTYPVFAMKLLCFALFACAFNLLLGYVGLLSFGHAAFFGGAAYITGHVITAWGFAPLPGILTGTLFAMVLGAIFGALAIRRQGIYFAMITLALAQIIFFLALKLPFTGGENGLQVYVMWRWVQIRAVLSANPQHLPELLGLNLLMEELAVMD